MQKDDYVFVYGTLRLGEGANLRYLKTAEYIGEDRVNGLLYNLGSFPGLKAKKRQFTFDFPIVCGDVYCLTETEQAMNLDRYEGYPSLYSRIQTETESGITVWTYIYNGMVYDKQLISSGDWKARHSSLELT